MKDIETKREREKKMISQMIALYCRRNHHTRGWNPWPGNSICYKMAKKQQ